MDSGDPVVTGPMDVIGVGACFACSGALVAAAQYYGRKAAALDAVTVASFVGPVEEATTTAEARVLENPGPPYDFPGPARPARHEVQVKR